MPLLLQIKIPGHYPIDPDLLLRAIAEWQARHPGEEPTSEVIWSQVLFILRYHNRN